MLARVNQHRKRLHRFAKAHLIGQQRPVTVYRLVRQGTLEERIVALHHDKRELAAQVLDGGAGYSSGVTVAFNGGGNGAEHEAFAEAFLIIGALFGGGVAIAAAGLGGPFKSTVRADVERAVGVGVALATLRAGGEGGRHGLSSKVTGLHSRRSAPQGRKMLLF